MISSFRLVFRSTLAYLWMAIALAVGETAWIVSERPARWMVVDIYLFWGFLLALTFCWVPCGLCGLWTKIQWKRRGCPPTFPEVGAAEFSTFVFVFLLFIRSMIVTGWSWGFVIPGAAIVSLLAFWLLRHRQKTVWVLRVLVLLLTAGTLTYLLLGLYLGDDRFQYRLPKLRSIAAQRQSLPNVLLVVVDTLRAKSLSTYGYSQLTSPFLTQMAAEGVLFTRHYATASWTPPATVSILTGLYPSVHGMLGITKKTELRPEISTIFESLKEEGYNTAAISSNGWVNLKSGARGSDYFRGITDRPSRFFFWAKVEGAVRRWGGAKARGKLHAWFHGPFDRLINPIIKSYARAVGRWEPWMEIDLPRASNIGETFLHYLDKVGSTPGFDRKKHKFFF